jgi:tetratricopeptide (TPR) repeat protein
MAYATVALATGQWDEAESHFPAENQSVAYAVYMQIGRLRDAERILRRVHGTTTSWPVVPLNLALLRDYDGDYRGSLSFIEIAVRSGISEDTRPVQALKANAAEAAGHYADAANHMMKLLPPSLRAQGGDAAVHLYYEALEKPGSRPRALAAIGRLERALDHERYSSYLLRLLLIVCYTRLEALDDAYRLADDWLAQYRHIGLVGSPHLSTLWSHQMRDFRRDARFAKFATGLKLMDYWKKNGPPDGCKLDAEELRCD